MSEKFCFVCKIYEKEKFYVNGPWFLGLREGGSVVLVLCSFFSFRFAPFCDFFLFLFFLSLFLFIGFFILFIYYFFFFFLFFLFLCAFPFALERIILWGEVLSVDNTHLFVALNEQATTTFFCFLLFFCFFFLKDFIFLVL